MTATVVIPVERGREWDRGRATRFPPGTPYIVAEFDKGEWAQAVNDAVAAASTECVVLSAPDVWFEWQPPAVEFLADLCWDAAGTWGPLHLVRDGARVGVAFEGAYCSNRLSRENCISPVFCVRKDVFQGVGGMRSGAWDLHWRIHEAGGRFKYVPEAAAARDEPWEDKSDPPPAVDVRATFYHQATPGTTYWRCQLPARFLPGQTVFNVPSTTEDGDGRLAFVNHAGAAVFQYAGDAYHDLLVRTMRGRGIRTLVEVDDDYTRWAREVMRRAGWNRYVSDCTPERGFSVEQHRATVAAADGVIVTTERLAKIYRPLNPNVFVCPNQIDPADWPELVKPDDGVFRIGWFASASHQGDEKLIHRALEWAARQPNVEVCMIGIGASASGNPTFRGFPYRFFPWSNDLGVYRKFLLNLDVGLAPVTGNPWALCRSDLKALEYAMAGAVPIVSEQPPYEGCDVPGIIHCKDAKAFLLAVQWCVNNRDEVRQLAAEARDHVTHERSVKSNIHLWESACST